jgi:hypothetical protein
MDTQEVKARLDAALAGARGFRHRLALLVAEHPNTTTAYLIVTFPLAVYGLYKVLS